MENKTPIQEWIANKRNEVYDKFNNSMAKKVSYTRGCQELLTYLGLQDVSDPKKWVEEINKSSAILPLMMDMYNFLNDVKNENKPFTCNISIDNDSKEFPIISLWASPSDVCDNPIVRVQQIADEREKLQAENERLREELKVLKGETT